MQGDFFYFFERVDLGISPQNDLLYRVTVR